MSLDRWIRGLVTIGLVGVSAYLWVMGRAVPDALLGLAGLAVGQYLPSPGTVGGKA